MNEMINKSKKKTTSGFDPKKYHVDIKVLVVYTR